MAATLVLLVVLNVLGDDRTALVAVVGTPLVVVLFKIAGLYDRDELRLVHSTLDEAPALLQLTGLFALGVTIAQSAGVGRRSAAWQIAALWLASSRPSWRGRMVARSARRPRSPRPSAAW